MFGQLYQELEQWVKCLHTQTNIQCAKEVRTLHILISNHPLFIYFDFLSNEKNTRTFKDNRWEIIQVWTENKKKKEARRGM